MIWKVLQLYYLCFVIKICFFFPKMIIHSKIKWYVLWTFFLAFSSPFLYSLIDYLAKLAVLFRVLSISYIKRCLLTYAQLICYRFFFLIIHYLAIVDSVVFFLQVISSSFVWQIDLCVCARIHFLLFLDTTATKNKEQYNFNFPRFVCFETSVYYYY